MSYADHNNDSNWFALSQEIAKLCEVVRNFLIRDAHAKHAMLLGRRILTNVIQELSERSIPKRWLANQFTEMTATHGDVAIIAADFYLRAFLDGGAIIRHSDYHGCFRATVTNCFQLFEIV